MLKKIKKSGRIEKTIFIFLTLISIILQISCTKSISKKKDHKLCKSDDNKKKEFTPERLIRPEFTELVPDDHSTPLKLSKEQIGRYTWSLLHSIAASYSIEPTLKEKESFVGAVLFPCKICREHFIELIANNPIKNNSRQELVLYLCDIHNQVNKRLNKPIFDCEKASDFWGGDCGCSGNSENIKSNKSAIDNPKEAKVIVEPLHPLERRNTKNQI